MWIILFMYLVFRPRWTVFHTVHSVTEASFDQLYLVTSGFTSVWISLYWILFSYLYLYFLTVCVFMSFNQFIPILSQFIQVVFFMTSSNSLNSLNMFIAVLFFVLNSSFQILSKSFSSRTIIMGWLLRGILSYFCFSDETWTCGVGLLVITFARFLNPLGQTLEVGCGMGILRKIRRDRGGSQ